MNVDAVFFIIFFFTHDNVTIPLANIALKVFLTTT